MIMDLSYLEGKTVEKIFYYHPNGDEPHEIDILLSTGEKITLGGSGNDYGQEIYIMEYQERVPYIPSKPKNVNGDEFELDA